MRRWNEAPPGRRLGRGEGTADTRLRNVEIAFGKVARRLLTIGHIILPAPDQPGQ